MALVGVCPAAESPGVRWEAEKHGVPRTCGGHRTRQPAPIPSALPRSTMTTTTTTPDYFRMTGAELKAAATTDPGSAAEITRRAAKRAAKVASKGAATAEAA